MREYLIEALRAVLSPEALKTTLGPTVAILLFMFSNIAQFISGRAERRRATKRVAIGIYTEMSHNLKYTRLVVQNTNLFEEIKRRLTEDDAEASAQKKHPEYRPLIVVTDSAKFYETNLTSVIDIDANCVAPIALYYRSVADQHLAMSAINSDAFLKVSVNSRLSTIDDLRQAIVESCSTADIALASLRRAYPARWFAPIKP